MEIEYKYVNQKQLGKMFGVSSHEIGKWLEAIGLRENKRPSWRAHQGEFVETAPTGRAEGSYYYVWDREKILAALINAGYRLVDEEVGTERTEESTLIGPFEWRKTSEDGYEIVSGDGITSIWVRGKDNTAFVLRMLNLAYKWGKLQGVPLNKVG